MSAMMETIKDLNSLITWCTADEGGRLGTPDIVGGVKHSQLKQLRLARNNRCGYCGGNKHGDGDRNAREKYCKAFDKTCSKCQKKGHLPFVCKSSAPTTAAITQEGTPETSFNGALSFFAIQQEPKVKFTLWRPWLPYPHHVSPDLPLLSSTCLAAPVYAVPTHNRFAIFGQQNMEDMKQHDEQTRAHMSDPIHHLLALASARRSIPTLAPARRSSPALAPARRPYPALAPAKSLNPALDPARKLIPALAPAPVAEPSMHCYDSTTVIPTSPAQLLAIIEKMKANNQGPVSSVKLPHILHDIHQGWLLSSPRKNPYLNLSLKVHPPSYKTLGLDIPIYAMMVLCVCAVLFRYIYWPGC